MWKRFEDIFIVFALLFCAGAFLPLLNQSAQVSDERPPNAAIAAMRKQASAQTADPTQAHRGVVASQMAMYGILAVLLLRHRRALFAQMSHAKFMWAILALAFLSCLWSDVPFYTFRRCVNLAVTTSLGLYIATRYSPRQLLRVLGWTMALTVVGSILAIVLMPDAGIDSAGTNHAWRGVFGQKNSLGRMMTLGILVYLFLAYDNKSRRLFYGFAALVCTGMLYMAGSATSAVAVPILIGLIYLFRISRRRPTGLVFASAMLAIVGFTCAGMLFFDGNDFFSLLGRDSSFSGRLDIWSAVMPKIMANPWLGYGFSSFWLGLDGQQSADLWSMLHWNVPYSHNGFLDLVEELGVVGLGLFMAGFVVSMRRALLWARVQRESIGLWPLAYLSFMFLFNLTEGSLLRQDNLYWVLYVATFIFIMAQTDALLMPSPSPLYRRDIGIAPQYATLHAGADNVGSQS